MENVMRKRKMGLKSKYTVLDRYVWQVKKESASLQKENDRLRGRVNHNYRMGRGASAQQIRARTSNTKTPSMLNRLKQVKDKELKNSQSSKQLILGRSHKSSTPSNYISQSRDFTHNHQLELTPSYHHLSNQILTSNTSTHPTNQLNPNLQANSLNDQVQSHISHYHKIHMQIQQMQQQIRQINRCSKKKNCDILTTKNSKLLDKMKKYYNKIKRTDKLLLKYSTQMTKQQQQDLPQQPDNSPQLHNQLVAREQAIMQSESKLEALTKQGNKLSKQILILIESKRNYKAMLKDSKRDRSTQCKAVRI